MITNIPTPAALNHVALRLYYSAWASLVSMKDDFRNYFPSDDDWSNEWEEYLAGCQPELQTICATIQQSNELTLKARVCEISPYLLLIRNDQKFNLTPREIDFSDLRTLDAVELPSAVNSFCSSPLSESFVRTYNEVRILRNKIAHLGGLERSFRPEELLRLLVSQYLELWPQRAWLNDRLRYASETRTSFFHDGKYETAEMVIMHEWPGDVAFFTNAEFKALFGHHKKTRRYRCHSCVYEASTRNSSEDRQEWKTAFLSDDGKSVHCIMCLNRYPITKETCRNPQCKGTIIAADEEHLGECHTCGEDSSDGSQA